MSTPTADPKPRPKRRPWLILLPVILIALAALAMAIPGSPVYLPKVLQLEMELDGRRRSEWGADLSSADKEQRVKAAGVLGKMNEGGRQELPKLVKAIQTDPEADVRAACADAATKMYPELGSDKAKGEYAAAVLEVFTAGLTDSEKRVRYTSAVGLLKLKALARPAVPALLAGCKDPDNDTNMNLYHATIQQVMLKALGEAAAGTPDAVPIFTALLDEKLDKPKRVGNAGNTKMTKEEQEEMKSYAEALILRRLAVTGLGLAKEHGKPAAGKIRELLSSDIDDDKFVAKEALERMGEPLN